MPNPAKVAPTEPANKRAALLEAAARHFAASGFESASMRDIARDAGMLAGSIYYHFSSKDELIAAVYELGVEQIIAAVEGAVSKHDEAWAKLEAAAVAHLSALLAESAFAAVLTADLKRLAPDLRGQLVTLRDRYDLVFKRLVGDLPLASDVDRDLLRLQILGSLNWAPTWYRPDGATPAQLARAFIRTLRRDQA